MAFWKVSHGAGLFEQTDYDYFFENRLIVVGGDKQVKSIRSMNRGDYFYLTYSNANGQGIQLLGKINDDSAQPCDYSGSKCDFNGWEQRKYELIKSTVAEDKIYKGIFSKGWTPNFNSTIFCVPKYDEKNFETHILRPFFGMKIDPTTHAPIDVDEKFSSQPSAQIEPMAKNFSLNQIFFGPPGTGKTFLTATYAVAICDNKPLKEIIAEDYDTIKNRYDELKDVDKRIDFVTFHQSYGYEDFIEGIKPIIDKRRNISYKIKSGVFKKFCEMAAENPAENFVFIIDEINRGNISKIFGELITLIEDDKREKISVTLPYSQESFTVPKNVYIIGTMNTADRSIALIDTALRRRFNFVEMMPRPELLSDNVDGVNLQTMLETLNTRIETLLDREHTIGHAYFIKCKTLADVKEAFLNKVIPLLQEYFFDDYEQIRLVLGEKFIDKKILPTLGDVDEKYRYTINESAFDDPESYKL